VLGLAGDLDPLLARLLAEPAAAALDGRRALGVRGVGRGFGAGRVPMTVISSRSSLMSGAAANQSLGMRPLNHPRSFSLAEPETGSPAVLM